MRFLPQGADIPDELIRAVKTGSATFLCGAGVSRRVGLPSFEQLTYDVYARLQESPNNEPAERNTIASREYDRTLRSLEKRTHRPRTASRVRDAVSDLLSAPPVALPDHFTLLQLSRNADGKVRLLTTNFDTLFEHAARTGGLAGVPSHAGKALPKPGGESDEGILHLHGRIADAVLGLDRIDFVLTSADFGDAYLRDGWASRYIEDRMRVGTLVLVGYAAEDAALRLLLEALDADRNRFPDLKVIYAIERASVDSAALWKAKGIKPVEFTDYDAIYDTLAEWARYAAQPAAYAQARIQAILTNPGAPTP